MILPFMMFMGTECKFLPLMVLQKITSICFVCPEPRLASPRSHSIFLMSCIVSVAAIGARVPTN